MHNTGSKALLFRLNATKLISITAIILLLDSILLFMSRYLGSVGNYIGFFVFIARISLYIVLFFVFKYENQAEVLDFDKKNGLLKGLQIASIVFLVVALLSFLLNMLLDAAIANEQNLNVLRIGIVRVQAIKYAIDLVANVFSNINLIALFAIKIYLDEDKDHKLRSTALASSLIIILHLLAAVVKYLIKYIAVGNMLEDMLANPENSLASYSEQAIGSPFFNVFAIIMVYASYLVILLMSDYRRRALQKELAVQKEQEAEVFRQQ